MNIEKLLTFAIENKASDLHLSSGRLPLIRVDGDLLPIENEQEIKHEVLLESLKKVLPPKRYEDLFKNLEVDLSLSFSNLRARFRVNVFFQLHGVSAAFRIIPLKIATLEELHMPKILYNLAQLPYGLVLVTGPTGCGKSTTLAAMIDHINKNRSCHIVTIEDPIEFVYQKSEGLLQQREVHQQTKSFANALRAALREDPDVILVGEMRDLETMRLAMTAAETGHLVFATLHTNSAAKAINRIIDVFPVGEKELIRTMLSESLQAVIAQRLFKKKGKGRIAAQEIMLCNLAIRNLIRENKVPQIESIIQTGKAEGMQTFKDSIHGLVSENIVDVSSVEHLRV
ncbi:MAG: type IV pilus twitching motility protein PilT [Gammaproteobacteria bacterium]